MKIVLDRTARTVEANGILVRLTRKEFDLMELLTVRGDVVSRDQVFDYLYGGVDMPDPKILDVFICKIRGKLRRSGLNLIETVWGRGYKVAA